MSEEQEEEQPTPLTPEQIFLINASRSRSPGPEYIRQAMHDTQLQDSREMIARLLYFYKLQSPTDVRNIYLTEKMDSIARGCDNAQSAEFDTMLQFCNTATVRDLEDYLDELMRTKRENLAPLLHQKKISRARSELRKYSQVNETLFQQIWQTVLRKMGLTETDLPLDAIR